MPGQCRPCGMYKTSKAVKVLGEGYRGASIACVGEGLGETEERLFRPFVGKAGGILDQSLFEANLSRTEVWITNSVRCRPINALGENRTPTGHELLCCRGWLDDELATLPNLKVIVALGASAAWSILEPKCPTGGVLENQGKVLWSERYGCWVVFTLHPAYIARKRAEQIWLTFDLMKAQKVVQYGHLPEPRKVEHRVVRSLADLDEMRSDVLAAHRLAFDWETDGVDYVKSVGFCVSFATDRRENFAWVVPRYGAELMPWWSRGDLSQVDNVLRGIFRSPVEKIGHNVKFDVIITRSTLGEWPTEIVGCTMIQHHLINNHLGERAHSLKRMSEFYTPYGRYDDPLDQWLMANGYTRDGKPNGAFIWKAPNELIHPYNATDSVVTLFLEPLLAEKIRAADLWDVYTDERMPAVREYMEIDRAGQRIDLGKLDQLGEDLAKIMSVVSAQILDASGKEINWNSPKQVSKYVYEERGFPVIARTPTGAPSVKEEVLIQFAEEDEAIKLVLNGRGYGKLKGSFVDGRKGHPGGLKAAVSMDGRARTDTLMHVIETFRLATRKPFPIHTIPRPIVLWSCEVHELKYQFSACCEFSKRVTLSIRSLIIPDDGYLFAQADFQQQEYSIASIISGQTNWEEALLDRGEDAHDFVMKLLSGRSILDYVTGRSPDGEWIFPDKQTADQYKNDRADYKRLNFSILFRARERSLARNLSHPGNAKLGIPARVVDEVDAARMISDYYERLDQVKWWQYRTIMETRRTGMVVSPFKTYRKLPAIFSADKWDQFEAERQACNAPIQMSGYHVTIRGVLRLMARWRGKLPLRAPFPGRVNFTIHDETLAQIRADLIEEGMDHVRADLTAPHAELVGGCGIPRGIPVDLKAGPAWGEAREKLQKAKGERVPLLT